MGKLGKKARKFAKKGLQSIHRQNRKTNSHFKRKTKSPRDIGGVAEGQYEDNASGPELRNLSNQDVEDESLEIFPCKDEDKLVQESSDSDEYLSEDSTCFLAVSDNVNHLEENGKSSSVFVQNQKLLSEIKEQNKKLDKLKQKDPGFLCFLEQHKKKIEALGGDDTDSGEEEADDTEMQSENGNASKLDDARSLTSSIVNNWAQLVIEQHSISALPSLLNAYRTACHFGAESSHANNLIPLWRLQDSDTFFDTIMFMLREGDSVFNDLLSLPSTNRKKETVLGLQNTPKWKQVKPMIKSFFRSTLFLLSQITDSEILVFSLSRLRASLTYFAPFKSLLKKLVQVTVNLWATSADALLSSWSLRILHDVALMFGSDIYIGCIKNMYKAYISCCNLTDPVDLNHSQSLRDSFVDFLSIDLQKSLDLALVSTQRLIKIFESGYRLKRKDALKKVCSWEYVLSMDLWVQFVSANVKENNLQGFSFSIIQLINGIAILFSGPRYIPLRIRCVQWLNQLSSDSGMFIPVSSLALDLLECNAGKGGKKAGVGVNFQKTLKLPKDGLKSQKLQEECALAAVELLSAHFAQWSYHISFSELATIPVVRLRRFLEKSTVESSCTAVKRLVDQTEKNIEFVQRKRENIPFSPKDQESASSFVQSEQSSANTPFSQYYRSIIEKAALRNGVTIEKLSSGKQNKSKRRKYQPPSSTKVVSTGLEVIDMSKFQDLPLS